MNTCDNHKTISFPPTLPSLPPWATLANLGLYDLFIGLSAKTRQALVNTFGSVGQAKVAGEAELRRIPGVGPIIAKRILE